MDHLRVSTGTIHWPEKGYHRGYSGLTSEVVLAETDWELFPNRETATEAGDELCGNCFWVG